MCLHALRPKSPTGKLDFLSNSWALEPSRAWGHEGPSSAHQQASPYLCQWVFKKMVILSVLNRLVQYITSIGTVISQQFTVRCIHWEHRRGRRKGWGSQRDILKKHADAAHCCYNDAVGWGRVTSRSGEKEILLSSPYGTHSQRIDSFLWVFCKNTRHICMKYLRWRHNFINALKVFIPLLLLNRPQIFLQQ